MAHIPVLKKEVIEYLNPKPNENFIDCTIGEGGHSLTILEKISPEGKILGIDWNLEAIEKLKIKIENLGFKKNLILVCDNFANLEEIVEKNKFWPVNGILFDLGMSSWEIEESGKGFTFKKDEPLIMSYSHNVNSATGLTAMEIINNWQEEDIEKILKEYGEEKFGRSIAREIVRARKIKPIKTTFQLVEIIKKATPAWYHYKKIHPATKTFQALRIAVNDELNNLKKALPQTLKILKNGGRIVIISFHSLEDKIVKIFFKEKARQGRIKILTKKPVIPQKIEIKNNPRARSAKLRAVEVL
jgi:16S rRNA (cytosine1402-N4)-methyltransferase